MTSVRWATSDMLPCQHGGRRYRTFSHREGSAQPLKQRAGLSGSEKDVVIGVDTCPRLDTSLQPFRAFHMGPNSQVLPNKSNALHLSSRQG